MNSQNSETTCCVVGGGPAGMMLALLLARQGVRVTVLEKHKDFFRDFRGDTVHPSTLQLMFELGFLNDFLKVPHQRLTSAGGVIGDFAFRAADFRHVPSHCKFVALMPQWDLLDFLAERAGRFSTFDLRMEHEAVGLIESAGRITGVKVKTPNGIAEVKADLVVGCDGRHAVTRQAARLELQEFGVPIDVLWFRISRTGDEPEQLLGNINYGKVLILIPRDGYFQTALIIRKGSFDRIQDDGFEAFRRNLLLVAPFLGERVQELQDWDQIKLLSVQISRLRRWYRSGLLCIGDAAHAMSPVGGVGINLAIQDAVATANLLAGSLLERRVTQRLLAQLQRRRQFPTRVTQFLQVNAHKALMHVLENPGPATAPWQLRAVQRVPGAPRVLARVIGIGIRPEHIDGVGDRANRESRSSLPTALLAGFAAGLLAAGIGLALGLFTRLSSQRASV